MWCGLGSLMGPRSQDGFTQGQLPQQSGWSGWGLARPLSFCNPARATLSGRAVKTSLHGNCLLRRCCRLNLYVEVLSLSTLQNVNVLGDKVFKENHVIKLVKSTLGLFPCRCESHGRQRFRSIQASAPPLPWHHGCNPPHLGGGRHFCWRCNGH